VASLCLERFCLGASMSRSTSRSVRYSRPRRPTVTFMRLDPLAKPCVFHGNGPLAGPYCYKSPRTCNRAKGITQGGRASVGRAGPREARISGAAEMVADRARTVHGRWYFDPLPCLVLSMGGGDEKTLQSRRQGSQGAPSLGVEAEGSQGIQSHCHFAVRLLPARPRSRGLHASGTRR
jgi:hypothetical protein